MKSTPKCSNGSTGPPSDMLTGLLNKAAVREKVQQRLLRILTSGL